jgi:hypothetical protein
MQKKPWKLIAHIEESDGRPGCREYFLVRDVDRYAAIATLLKGRPDLGNLELKSKVARAQTF